MRISSSRLLDLMLIILLLITAWWCHWRVGNVLEYEWQWGELVDYIGYEGKDGTWHAGALLRGLSMTIRLSIWSMLCALVFGLFFGLLRTKQRLLSRLIAGTYVGIIRNVPPIILVFILYFFVSSQLLPMLGIQESLRALPMHWQNTIAWLFASPMHIDAFVAGVVTLGLYEGAYIAEIVRAGIESVPKGQWEASSAFGLSRWQQMTKVILPQALRHAIPPLSGQFISTIKDSAIVSVISVQELTFQGMELMAATYLTFEIWLTVALCYALLTTCFSLLGRWLEKRMRWNT